MPPIARGRIWPRRRSWSRGSSIRGSIPSRISIASTQMGDAAFHFVAKDPGHDAPLAARIDAVNRYLFGELGFAGNREQFDDPRNSCLNEVMDRKKGIPITMALIYIEVARRAGIRSEGVNFPGHFLVRCLQDLHTDDPSARA